MKSKSAGERIVEKVVFAPKNDSIFNSIAGKRFVLVDDVVTFGTTTRYLARFLENAGGSVEGYVSLFKGRDNYTDTQITNDQIQNIEERVGRDNVERYTAEQGFANRLEQLSRRQAEAILSRGKLDSRGFSINGRTSKKSGENISGSFEKSQLVNKNEPRHQIDVDAPRYESALRENGQLRNLVTDLVEQTKATTSKKRILTESEHNADVRVEFDPFIHTQKRRHSDAFLLCY